MRTGHSTLQNFSARFHSNENGLSSAEAVDRLRRYGKNELREQHALSRLRVLANQLGSQLLLLLVFAAAASAFTGEWVDATIVLVIVAATVVIGYSREYSAEAAAAALRARVRTHTQVLRDGSVRAAPVEEIVPGDVVLLSADNLFPLTPWSSKPPTVSSVKQFLQAGAFPHRRNRGRFLRLLRSTGPHAG
jgi:P-type Mg2+ transporter